MIREKNVIVLLNKSDLEAVVTKEQMEQRLDHQIISVSAKNQEGIKDITDAVADLFFHGDLSYNDEVFITNARHKSALQDANESMELVRNSIKEGLPEDFYSIDLINAYDSLGYIIGESLGEDLVNEIFSKFCMGK
jgi:tRNA modification GTPase